MPSGNVHNAATTSIIVAFTTVYALKVNTPLEFACLGVGAMANYFMSPDLDVDAGFIGYSKIKRFPIIGQILSWCWRTIWTPYAFVISHRSWVSHAPVISTVIRIGYLYLVLWLLSWVLGLSTTLLEYAIYRDTGEFLRLAFIMFCGLCNADTSHYFLDNAEPDRE